MTKLLIFTELSQNQVAYLKQLQFDLQIQPYKRTVEYLYGLFWMVGGWLCNGSFLGQWSLGCRIDYLAHIEGAEGELLIISAKKT